MNSLETLQARLGYVFRQPELLRLALTHPSVAHEAGGLTQHNQRLEFLGDAVLGLVLSGELYEQFPTYGEGLLTKGRAQMVNRRALAEHSRRLELGGHLILSRGEERHGGRDRQSTLADAFEALLGAIYLDGGFEAARDFILRQFRALFGDLAALPRLDNPKGELQEMLQADSKESPQYRVNRVTGPDHDRNFECTVHHGDRELGRGQGKSKKTAETAAALAALATLRQAAAITAAPAAPPPGAVEPPKENGPTTAGE